jgi:hypothetical protein
LNFSVIANCGFSGSGITLFPSKEHFKKLGKRSWSLYILPWCLPFPLLSGVKLHPFKPTEKSCRNGMYNTANGA